MSIAKGADEATLARAGLDALPATAVGLLAFSGVHLVGALDRVFGPKVGKRFLEDLAQALDQIQ